MRKYILYVLIIVFILASINCKTLSTSPVKQPFHKEMDLQENSSIFFENMNGDLEIIGWEKNKIEINAMRIGTSSQLRQTDIKIKKKDNTLNIKTLFPRADIRQVFVDFTLHVPKRILFKEIKIVKGDLRTQNIHGELRATITEEGKVSLDNFSGICEVLTDRGYIVARIYESSESDDYSFKNTDGNVHLHLPPDLNAHITAETRLGEILSDFTPDQRKPASLKTLNETIGKGNVRIRIKTWSGNIQIKKNQ